MHNFIVLCPFIGKANGIFLYSWLISREKSQESHLTTSMVTQAAHAYGISKATAYRQLNSMPENSYFQLTKKDKGYTLKRSSQEARYLSLKISSEFFHQKNLTCSEKILFAAILINEHYKKPAMTRKALACRTGFSLRQIAYSLKSLEEKGLLTSFLQEESYSRKSQGKTINDTRERAAYKICVSIYKEVCCKIAPLKDIYIPQVKDNRSFTKKSDLTILWNFYQKHFQHHSFETFQSTVAYVRKASGKSICPKKSLEVLKKVLKTPFLKLANTFGWEEAATECYGRKGCLVGTSSRHMDKYTKHKPGLAWYILHADKILQGAYAQKPVSPRQAAWQKRPNSQKHLQKPLAQAQNAPTPCKEFLIQEIQHNAALTLQEKTHHLSILEIVGALLYRSWISTCRIAICLNGDYTIQAPNPFVRDMVERRIIQPFGHKLKGMRCELTELQSIQPPNRLCG